MEIKTEEQIIKGCGYIDVVRIDHPNRRWVAVDDVIKAINDCIGFGEYKTIEKLHELMESLSTSQSEGTELSFKVPSHSSDKPCPKCNGTKKIPYYNDINQLRYKSCDCKTGKARL